MSFVKNIWGQDKIKKIAYYSNKITFYVILAFLFLLSWQTRYIFGPAEINGQPWEYGTKSLYGTELLIWIIMGTFLVSKIIYLRSWPQTFIPIFKKNIYKTILVSSLVLGLILVSSIGSNPPVSYYFVYRIILGMLVSYIIFYTRKSIPTSTLRFLLAFWSSGVIQGILAITQFFSQFVFANKWLGMSDQWAHRLGTAVIELATGRWLRAYGSFGWPNSLGMYLAVTWIIGLVVYITYNNSLKFTNLIKALLTGGQLLILSGLILSFSRSAWVAAGGGVVYLTLFSFARHRKEIKNIIFQILYSLSIIAFFFIIINPLFTTRFTVSNRLEQRSVNERVGQWQEARQIFFSHPLQGVGPGAVTWYFHTTHPDFNMWEIQPTHNIYLLGLIEMGVVVFSLFGILCIWFLKNIIKYNPLYLSVIIVMLLTGLLDHWLWSLYGGMMTWWVVWGLSYGYVKKES